MIYQAAFVDCFAHSGSLEHCLLTNLVFPTMLFRYPSFYKSRLSLPCSTEYLRPSSLRYHDIKSHSDLSSISYTIGHASNIWQKFYTHYPLFEALLNFQYQSHIPSIRRLCTWSVMVIFRASVQVVPYTRTLCYTHPVEQTSFHLCANITDFHISHYTCQIVVPLVKISHPILAHTLWNLITTWWG